MSKISNYYATKADPKTETRSDILQILSPKLGNPAYANQVTYQVLGCDGFHEGKPYYAEEVITKTGKIYAFGLASTPDPSITISQTSAKTFSDEREGVRVRLEFNKEAKGVETATLTYAWPNRESETRVFIKTNEHSSLGL